MKYITVLTKYRAMASTIAKDIEVEVNKKDEEGFEPVSFSITNNNKAIILFKKKSQ